MADRNTPRAYHRKQIVAKGNKLASRNTLCAPRRNFGTSERKDAAAKRHFRDTSWNTGAIDRKDGAIKRKYGESKRIGRENRRNAHSALCPAGDAHGKFFVAQPVADAALREEIEVRLWIITEAQSAQRRTIYFCSVNRLFHNCFISPFAFSGRNLILFTFQGFILQLEVGY
jgi:hypothetical protein